MLRRATGWPATRQSFESNWGSRKHCSDTTSTQRLLFSPGALWKPQRWTSRVQRERDDDDCDRCSWRRQSGNFRLAAANPIWELQQSRVRPASSAGFVSALWLEARLKSLRPPPPPPLGLGASFASDQRQLRISPSGAMAAARAGVRSIKWSC